MAATDSQEAPATPQGRYSGWLGGWWRNKQANSSPGVDPSSFADSSDILNDNGMENLSVNDPWYRRLYHRVWNNNPATSFLSIDDDTRYSQLNVAQIDFLQEEAVSCISSHRETWCWFENLSDIGEDSTEEWTQRDGILSVFNTGCGRCPLPLPRYPLNMFNGYSVLMKNSILLPSNSPLDYLHELPLRTKLANTVKEYYNFQNEQHLYLKSTKSINNSNDFNPDTSKRFVIISMVGWLPERYEKLSIGEQRTAQYLSKKLSQSLNSKFANGEGNNDKSHSNNNNEIISLSFECPLHCKTMEKILDECMFLLQHWENLLNDIDGIFFIGIYHSVPLLINFCYNIIQKYTIDPNFTKIGILSFESCLQGYRYWDHSVDKILPDATMELNPVENITNTTNKPMENDNSNFNPNTTNNNINDNFDNSNAKNMENKIPNTAEQEYSKFEQNREKQLFYGLYKDEIDALNVIKRYSNLHSKESKELQEKLDWLLFNCNSFRLNLISTMYDNFMTMNEKLAFHFKHPKIIRNIWCDGRYMDIDLKQPQNYHLPDFNLMTPNFQFNITIPRERRFELILMSNLLLLQNLGYDKFIPLFKLLSPYFISRSFNENTMTTTLKKQKQTYLKNWLQEQDNNWLNNIFSPRSHNNTIINNNQSLSNVEILKLISDGNEGFPERLNTVHEFIKYIIYQNNKNRDLLQIYSEIYDDDDIYTNFLDIMYYTKNPITPKHLQMHDSFDNNNNFNGRRTINGSILNSRNQYDLVWKFHECLCDFIHIKNLPIQDPITNLNFQLKLTPCARKDHDTEGKVDNNVNDTFAATGESLHNVKQKFNPTDHKRLHDALSLSKSKFKRNSHESVNRIVNIWTTFQPWTPRTRGLIKLRDILNILKSYKTSQQLCDDL